ncbi:hypothetical protein KIPB_005488 [Kipferlia bialata]|uniref:Uncharacterized protein n=1 Tax=Kipferlia bialata TaxID=797122 RepID=A0A9K3GI87_9EUKA|nr:hypothetical protein KIPB_005488 [Kipferlia bialata]|eukprot:g5488.t1
MEAEMDAPQPNYIASMAWVPRGAGRTGAPIVAPGAVDVEMGDAPVDENFTEDALDPQLAQFSLESRDSMLVTGQAGFGLSSLSFDVVSPAFHDVDGTKMASGSVWHRQDCDVAAVPLSLAYIDGPNKEQPFVAVGTLWSPEIAVFPADVLDLNEPMFTIGGEEEAPAPAPVASKKRSRRSRRAKPQQVAAAPAADTDRSVTCLSWEGRTTGELNSLLAGSADGSLRVWDLSTQQATFSQHMKGDAKRGAVSVAALSPYAQGVALGATQACRCGVYDTRSKSGGMPIKGLASLAKSDPENPVWDLCEGAWVDANTVVVGFDSGVMAAIDLRNVSQMGVRRIHGKSLYEGVPGAPFSLSASKTVPGMVVTGGADGFLNVLDTKKMFQEGVDPVVLNRQSGIGPVMTVSLSPDYQGLLGVGGWENASTALIDLGNDASLKQKGMALAQCGIQDAFSPFNH